jgi:hypothetical protein
MTDIFILPFGRAVWLVSAVLIALISFRLYCAFRFCDAVVEKQNMNWIYIDLLSLGTFCQQGACVFLSYICKYLVAILLTHFNLSLSSSALEERGISGRIICIMLYIAVILLYTSYSACIFALLQSTTDSIRNVADLYQSGMGLGVVDVDYSRHYFLVMPMTQTLSNLQAVSFSKVYVS